MKDRASLLKQAEAKFPAYLRAVVADEAFFPLDLVIGRTRKARDYEERRNELRKFRGAAESRPRGRVGHVDGQCSRTGRHGGLARVDEAEAGQRRL
jgi:hypothetical protein